MRPDRLVTRIKTICHIEGRSTQEIFADLQNHEIDTEKTGTPRPWSTSSDFPSSREIAHAIRMAHYHVEQGVWVND